MTTKGLKIFFYTILSIILSYYVAILAHEYGHATMAWLFGYKTSPFDIKYGSWYLMPVSEDVDYASILASGYGTREALIGISGISVTIILFLISLFFLRKNGVQKRPLILSFFFWVASINLMEMFSYLNRTFVMGDIGEFVQGLNISPLWVFIPFTILVCWGLYRFYRYELIKMFKLLPITTTIMRRIYLWFTFWTVPPTLIYWGKIVNADWQLLSNITNGISIIVIIFILIVCDPSRNWVKKTVWRGQT